MTEHIPQAPQGEFVLFTSADGQTRVERYRNSLPTTHYSQAHHFARLLQFIYAEKPLD